MAEPLQPGTGHDAGLSGDDQIRIMLREIVRRGGVAQMADLYTPVEAALNSKHWTLSLQGKSSLRFFINRVAKNAGYVHPYDDKAPGWRITAEGREFLANEGVPPEVSIDVDTGAEEQIASNTARGDAFESYLLRLLRAAYPTVAWYHQGRDKRRERGVDFVGNRLGDGHGEAATIGVQVKFHKENNAPTEREWLKFLSGCFARRVNKAIFVTSGRLTSEQRREAQEAGVLVIEGREEISRLASLHQIDPFELFGEDTEQAGEE